MAHLSKEKGLDPFPPWAIIRFIGIIMQIKLINHCQPVRVKQYRIYRELPGSLQNQLEGHKTLGARLISGLDPYLLN